jgi:shikimate kinase
MPAIILIGVPGAGKSTVGVLLAKTLGRAFIDTDILVQEQAGRLLQEIIDTDGPGRFLAIEERTVLSLHVKNAVIATGGSVVLSGGAMEQLKKKGVIVYLAISFAEMEKRLRNITTRGIVLPAGQGLRDMYDQRVPLYGKYADITITCSDDDFETVVEKIVRELETSGRKE